MVKENPRMADQKPISSDWNIKMDCSSKNLKKKQQNPTWIDYRLLEKLRDFRFFIFVEEFGDELIVDTK